MKKKLWLVSTTVLAGLALGITSVSADTNVSTNSSNTNSATVATANVNTDSSAASTQVSNSDAAVTSASADTNAQSDNVASEQQTITSAQPATATTSQARADWYSSYSTGWQSSRNYDGTYDWTYRKADGTRAEDEWLLINGSWYYFDASGEMVNNGWHYAPWYGQGNSYYFDVNGHYVTNSWHSTSNGNNQYPTWTYSKADGTRAEDEWLWINGAWYYFDASGEMVANGWHYAPWNGEYREYYFDVNGHCL